MAKFRFVLLPEERRTIVYYRGNRIGELESSKEACGRPCFLLDCDPGPVRRQFRGREKAAEALLTIHKILNDWERRQLSLRELIVRAWRTRPAGSPQQKSRKR